MKIVVLSVGWLLLRLLKIASCCFWNSSNFWLRLYLELHYYANISLRSFIFLNFYPKKSNFFLWSRWEAFVFLFFSKYSQKSRIITVCMCFFFFFVQQKIVSAELNLSLWSVCWGEEKYENYFSFTWQSYLQISFKYLLSDTFRRLYNLIPCNCLTKILFGSLFAGTLL